MAIEQGGDIHEETPFDQIKESVSWALKEGLMKSYVLKGPVKETNQAHITALLREDFETKKIGFMVFIHKDDGFIWEKVMQEINALSIPFQLNNGHGPLEDLAVFDRDSEALAKKNAPFIMLEIGESKQTEQEMIVLNVVNGIALGTAIEALKYVVQKTKGK